MQQKNIKNGSTDYDYYYGTTTKSTAPSKFFPVYQPEKSMAVGDFHYQKTKNNCPLA